VFFSPSLSEHGEEENLAVCFAPCLSFYSFFFSLGGAHYALFIVSGK